jgi:cytochrome b subunit of formate dehydrogenase
MKRYLVRFSAQQRLEHATAMLLFIVLAGTGLPQKFFEASWAQAIIDVLGGIDRVRWIHRAAGLGFVFFTFVHITDMVRRLLLGSGSLALVPTRRDFFDAIQQLRFYLGTTDVAPKYDKYDYKQKFEYWGLLLGSAIVISTGLVLLFPVAATRFLPGEIVPASKLAHGNEGLMALLIVLFWHIYNAHLNPDVFPFDTTIFTGKISLERLHHEHELEYDRLKENE